MKRVKKQKTPKQEEKQLNLGIKDPFKNKIFKIKGKTDVMLLQFEVKKFLKDSFFWFVIVSDAIMLAQQGFWLHNNIQKFPSLTPILNYNLSAENRVTDRYFLYIFPIISLISIIIGVIVTAKYYNKEKMLTKFILLCTLLASVSGSIILIHLTLNY
jgi:glucan phosphoethanolaminetransferase (alkaline phosphatase superfamily)